MPFVEEVLLLAIIECAIERQGKKQKTKKKLKMRELFLQCDVDFWVFFLVFSRLLFLFYLPGGWSCQAPPLPRSLSPLDLFLFRLFPFLPMETLNLSPKSKKTSEERAATPPPMRGVAEKESKM